MKVLLNGRLDNALGDDAQALEGCLIAELRNRLDPTHANAARSINCSQAVGSVCVGENYRIIATDEVELLPPVWGR